MACGQGAAQTLRDDLIDHEVQGVNRVTYDVTSKLPGTIEME